MGNRIFAALAVAIVGPAVLLAALAADPPVVVGRVDDDTGPVPNARVGYAGRPGRVRTDATGRFRLPFDAAGTRVVAAKNGCVIAGCAASRKPELRLRRLALLDDPDYEWVSPTPGPGRAEACGTCHAPLYDEWRLGGHATSAAGPAFREQYERLLKEHPDGAGVCAACHAPGLRPNPLADFDLREATKGQGELSGVHCDYCHKVAGVGRGEFGLTHGRFLLDVRRPPAREQIFFGPLDDAERGDDAFSPFQRDSRFCGACHEGNVFGVPVYTTFSEWRSSPAARAGQSCQSCHMAPTGTLTNIAPGHGGRPRDRHTLGNHTFWRGSQRQMLRDALRLDARIDGRELVVTLANVGAGHAVPTGFVDRNLVLMIDGKPVRIFAKSLRGRKGESAAPFWRADPEPAADTRLRPGLPDVSRYPLAAGVDRATIRVVHRRFWRDDPADIAVVERVVTRD